MHNSIPQPVRRTLLLLTLVLVGPFASQDINAQQIPQSAYAGMRWRSIGPFRGGWSTAAAGIAGQPNTMYFGAAGGGVWKTNDAGLTWHLRSPVRIRTSSMSEPDR
jgi:hypothetical protein